MMNNRFPQQKLSPLPSSSSSSSPSQTTIPFVTPAFLRSTRKRRRLHSTDPDGDPLTATQHVGGADGGAIILPVRSAERDTIHFPNPTSFEIPIKCRERCIITGISLRDVTLPGALFNVTEQNCMLYISESGYTFTSDASVTGPVFYSLRVPTGYYSIDTLVDTLNSMAGSWNPVTHALLNLQDANGPTSTHTFRVFNDYEWAYDATHLRVILKSVGNAAEAPPPTAGPNFQIHCPPYQFFKRTKESLHPNQLFGGAGAVNLVTPRRTDISIANIQLGPNLGGNKHVLSFNTTKCFHNLQPGAVIAAIHIQNGSSPPLRFDLTDVMLNPNIVIDPNLVIRDNYLAVTVSTSASPWPFSATDVLNGYIRPYATINSLWSMLGFRASRTNSSTNLPVTAVSTDLTNTYITVGVPIFASGTTPGIVGDNDVIVIPSGIGWQAASTPITLDASTITYSNDTFTIPIAQMTLTAPQLASSLEDSKLYITMNQTYVSDASFDLRGKTTQVHMVLRYNNTQIGRTNMIDHSTDGYNLDQVGPIFASWSVDSASFGSNTTKYDLTSEMGEYEFIGSGDIPDSGVLSISLVDEDGDPVAGMATLNWSCSLRFKYESTHD